MSFSNTVSGTSRRSGGFSLVELLVVISIIGLITGTMLLQYGSYDSEVLLNSLAYDIALSVRQAQSLSISVRGSEGSFDPGYGIHFAVGDEYTLFRDEDEDQEYDSGEGISTFSIGLDTMVSDLCVNDDTCDRDTLDIMFRRPEPDAIIVTSPAVGSISSGHIVLSTPKGSSRTVYVSVSGQIAVQQ